MLIYTQDYPQYSQITVLRKLRQYSAILCMMQEGDDVENENIDHDDSEDEEDNNVKVKFRQAMEDYTNIKQSRPVHVARQCVERLREKRDTARQTDSTLGLKGNETEE